jgi:biopolymer transport protein TolR
MAMNVGGSGGPKSEINVTPLVDVVLVMLIIFMVITPLLQMGHPINVPPKTEQVVSTPKDQFVIRLSKDGQIYLNREGVTKADYPRRLTEIMNTAAPELVFFAASGELPYEQVVEVLDIARNNGATNIGIVLEDLGG